MDKALQSMIDNMPSKTGKSLDEWLKILTQKGFEKHGAAVKYLKEEFGITHGFANTIVHLFNTGIHNGEDPVAKQYEGKESLLPIYETLKTVIKSLGSDVEFAPKKTYVSVRRKKQFAILQPSTKTRFDLGLNLKGKNSEGILEPSGSFNAMCSHRIKIHDTKQIDDKIVNWIKEAYQRAD